MSMDSPSAVTVRTSKSTFIEDIIAGNGVFAKLGEEWFDEYWMNYGITTMIKKGDKSKIVDVRTKKNKKDDDECA